jgi:hypothetical protein
MGGARPNAGENHKLPCSATFGQLNGAVAIPTAPRYPTRISEKTEYSRILGRIGGIRAKNPLALVASDSPQGN